MNYYQFLIKMKAINICIVIELVVFAVRADVKPNHDCSCKGYEKKSAECNWPASIQKCDISSEAYKNFFLWCDRLNSFRDKKRNHRIPEFYNRTLTCDSYKTEEQRRKEKCGLKVEAVRTMRSLPVGIIPLESHALNSADWRTTFPPPKNQDTCGSCWAFASIGLCEWYLKNISPQRSFNLSEQHLVDCDTSNSACEHGWPGNCLEFMAANGTVDSSYSYKNAKETCKSPLNFNPIAESCPEAIFEYYPSGNDARLKRVLSRTPVVGAMNVVPSFYQYESGLYSPSSCPSDVVNHAIMIVGFGKEPKTGKDAWIIRNSWGTEWGVGGYAYIDATNPNVCGLSKYFWYYPQSGDIIG